MWDGYIKWRKDNAIDNIFDWSDLTFSRMTMPSFIEECIICTDKWHRPVVYQCFADLSESKIIKVTEEQYVLHTAYKMEIMNHIVFPILSKVYNCRVEQMTLIMDLKGISIGVVTNSKIRSYIGKATEIGNIYYPEGLAKTFIINSPWYFSAMWAIIKLWLDKSTKKKFSICGSSFKKQLLEFIPSDQLPIFLGGTKEGSIHSWVLPWHQWQFACLARRKIFWYEGSIRADPLIAAQENIYDPNEIDMKLRVGDLKEIFWGSDGKMSSEGTKFDGSGLSKRDNLSFSEFGDVWEGDSAISTKFKCRHRGGGELEIFGESDMWGDVDEGEKCWPLESPSMKKC
jgi:hypothetical protein